MLKYHIFMRLTEEKLLDNLKPCTEVGNFLQTWKSKWNFASLWQYWEARDEEEEEKEKEAEEEEEDDKQEEEKYTNKLEERDEKTSTDTQTASLKFNIFRQKSHFSGVIRGPAEWPTLSGGGKKVARRCPLVCQLESIAAR